MTATRFMIYDPPRHPPQASGRREPAGGLDADRVSERCGPPEGAPSADEPSDAPGGLRPPLANSTAPGPYGRLAKKIASRTTDLIAVALIGIAALTVGRQLSSWWNTDSADLANPLAGLPSSQPEWTTGPVMLELGDSPVALRRESFEGSGEQAVERLLSVCLADVRSAAAPVQPLAPGERKMLDYLRTLPPLLESPEGGRVHFVPVPVPMAVGTREFPPREVPSGHGSDDNGGSDTDRRVVSWGLAMRQGEAAWTLFSFRAGAPAASEGGGFEVELPPASRRTLALRGTAGEQLVGFEGVGPAAEWARFFDAVAERRGWRVTGEWRVAGGAWTRGFEAGDSTHAQRSRIDVQFGPDERAGFSGLIAVMPLPEEKANR
ncbi:MAG: hypothetical protein WD069_16640 [Planctomycetales bacterium]